MSLNRFGMAALACALLLGACAREEAPEEPVAETGEEEEAPPVPVETSSPVRGNIYAIYSGTAPIEAFAEADVIAKVEGEVREILAEEGTDETGPKRRVLLPEEGPDEEGIRTR